MDNNKELLLTSNSANPFFNAITSHLFPVTNVVTTRHVSNIDNGNAISVHNILNHL